MTAGDGEGAATPSPFLQQAASFTALNLFPVPIEPGGKRPAIDWKPLQGRALIDRDWDEADNYLARWWGGPRPYNLGVLTGAKVWIDEEHTRYLVVVDADDLEAARLVEETWLGGPTEIGPPTPTVETAKGRHYWFTTDHGGATSRVRVEGLGVDVRGIGGLVVTPPSVHPSGHRYRWIVSPADCWPPAPLGTALEDLLWPLRKPPAPAPRVVPPPRRRRGYAAAALRREAEAVRSAAEGSRNDRLNRAAFALARFVRAGELSAREVGEELLRAALAAGLPQREAERTILSGLRGR